MAGPTHDHADAATQTPDVVRGTRPDVERATPTAAARQPSLRGQRHASDPTPVDQAPRRDRLTRRRALALQRAAGNRAVSGLLRHIQRVEVKEQQLSETLYNQQGAGGKAGAKQFTLNPNYEMTRQGDSGVTITVRIQFLSQSRNTVPKPANAPPGTPDLGDLVGEATEIPADDPRRAWASTVVQEGVKHWNGRLTLVGEETHLLSDDVTKKRLPVSFRAEPVFGLGDSAHSRVIVHPSSVVAGTPGNPIDAGNYYMNKGTAYGGDDKVIAAHEYGHLLGIPDEYSQSNEQLNALIHQAAPGNAPSAGKALDKATVERMVLVALKVPMLRQLDVAMPQVVGAIQAQQKLVTKRMASAARGGAASADVRTQLREQLAERAAGTVAPNVPGVVAFQTTTNFSNITQAGTGVTAGFSSRALSNQIRDAYWKALGDAESKDVVPVAGLGDVSINVGGSVAATTATGGAQATSAAGAATTLVGPAPTTGGAAPGGAGGSAPTGGGTPGLPAIAPPATLIDKLAALPTTWGAAGSAVETGITPDRFAAKMVGTLKAAQAVATIASLAGVGGIDTTSQLYQVAYALVTNAAQTAARELASELIGATMTPVLVTGVSDLQSAIGTEVGRVMGTPASGVAALGTPDPSMTAIVTAMKARLDADKAATKGTGRDPLGTPGGTAPDQDVTYSYQGLMGSNATTALRPDQFDPMVKQFNDRLTNLFEKPFAAETK
jgi:hypothetical protein